MIKKERTQENKFKERLKGSRGSIEKRRELR